MLGWSARILAVAWAFFWLWFGVANALEEQLPLSGIALYALRPGLIFCAIAAIAWYRAKLGGVLLILTGVAAAVLYDMYFGHMPVSTKLIVLATMAAPPEVCGVVLLWRAVAGDAL